MKSAHELGFTLIEVIAGILALAISFTLMTTLLFPQAQNSIDPIYQTRAAELGQTFLNEIIGKAFDECSNHDGLTLNSDCAQNPRGSFRCGELGISCTSGSLLGPEGSETRAQFNDVDDYHGLNVSGDRIENALGEPLLDLYNNFSVQVSVRYTDVTGVPTVMITDYKLIELTVTTPAGEAIRFTSIRGNY